MLPCVPYEFIPVAVGYLPRSELEKRLLRLLPDAGPRFIVVDLLPTTLTLFLAMAKPGLTVLPQLQRTPCTAN